MQVIVTHSLSASLQAFYDDSDQQLRALPPQGAHSWSGVLHHGEERGLEDKVS